MAVIQLNTASKNKETGAFAEGNGRRKFLVSLIKTDSTDIVPMFANKASSNSVSVWIPLEASMPDGTKVNPAQQLTHLIEQVNKAGKGQRVHLNCAIRNFTMDEPTPGRIDPSIVYQNLTVNLDDSVAKQVTVAAPAPWDIDTSNL